MIRQGDVLIIPIAEFPPGLKQIKRTSRGIVLAEGEVTGHAHVITDEKVTAFRCPKLNALFLEVTESPVDLKHEEHDWPILSPGKHRVVRQVEYTPAAIRQVAD